MKKNYLHLLLFSLMLVVSLQVFSQNSYTPDQESIENLNIYPNPVQGKTTINITSKLNLTKKIEVFNVLGKPVFSTIITGKELNISKLSKGVYILKITENKISATRKLVIK